MAGAADQAPGRANSLMSTAPEVFERRDTGHPASGLLASRLLDRFCRRSAYWVAAMLRYLTASTVAPLVGFRVQSKLPVHSLLPLTLPVGIVQPSALASSPLVVPLCTAT